MSKARAVDRLARAVALEVAILVAGCGGTMAFQGQQPIVIAGQVAPPPPPPAPPPEAPKPEEPPPRVELKDNKIEIHEKVQFALNKTTILEASFGLLSEVADVIKKNPQIKRISVEGHASAEGNAANNLKLSDGRANAVAKYLIEKGVEKDRLAAKGFGSTKPIADNTSDDGREKNRRVEFNILEQDITKKKVQIDPKTGKETVLEEQKSTEKKAEPAAASDKAAETNPDLKKPPSSKDAAKPAAANAATLKKAEEKK